MSAFQISATDDRTRAEIAAAEQPTRIVQVKKDIRIKNAEQAARNRARFEALGLRVINMLSSPGSGKTEFLRRTLLDLHGRLRAAVIVGDLATDNDALRLQESGAPVLQITTGGTCHLDAAMIARTLDWLELEDLDLLIIENVGNLVCPSSYDLGEESRVVLLSVTEGEDKPLKYPVAFRNADMVVLSKIDLAEVVGFDREAAWANIRATAPDATVIEASARSGQGMRGWYQHLEQMLRDEHRD